MNTNTFQMLIEYAHSWLNNKMSNKSLLLVDSLLLSWLFCNFLSLSHCIYVYMGFYYIIKCESDFSSNMISLRDLFPPDLHSSPWLLQTFLPIALKKLPFLTQVLVSKVPHNTPVAYLNHYFLHKENTSLVLVIELLK